MNKTITFLIFCCLTVFFSGQVRSQSQAIGSEYSGLTLDEFARKAESQFGIRLFYEPEILSELERSSISSSTELLSYLQNWLSSQSLAVSEDHRGYLFITRSSPLQTSLPKTIYPTRIQKIEPGVINQSAALSLSREFIPKVITVGNRRDGLGKAVVKLKGKITDLESGDPIPQAAILITDLERGIIADENGSFTASLPKGTHTMIVKDFGHEEARITLELLSSGELELALITREIQLEDVVISSQRDNPVQNTQMGFERVNTRTVKEVPVVLGEQDILKVATLLPGVQSVGEGSGGINVRGAPADQNLFYIQHVPVYNTSHLFGFFSAFNSDALSGFSLYKSNMPSEFGGRLAAIFDIQAKEASQEKFHAEGGISPITGRLLIGTPIQKGKSSAMIGIRSTYSNWILRRIPNNDFQNSNVYFGDVTAHLTFDLNEKNKLSVFGYGSTDNTDFGLSTSFTNQNLGGSVSWRHFMNDRNDLEVTMVHSRLGLTVANSLVPSEAYQLSNRLFHTEAKAAVTMRPNNAHRIRMGFNSILYQNDRGDYGPFGNSSLIAPINLGAEQGIETGIFAEDEIRVSERISFQAGLRYNVYTFLGPQEVYEYEPGFAKSEETIIDTLSFGNFQPVKTYHGLDWRVSGKYSLGVNWSLKGSINRTHQYAFLLSNTIALAPTDKWKLVDSNIQPMVGDQVSLGTYGNMFRGNLQVSLEGYVKRVAQLVEYRDGADLLVNEVPEWDVLQGDLSAYGIEVMVRKPTGRFKGWINYTYSRSIVTVDGGQNDLQVNFGLSYPANFDRPHAVNMVASYRFNRRVSISSNIVYASGRPITYPTSLFYLNNVRLVSFTTRNEYRLPDYFRVDLSVNIEGNLRSKKFAHGSWAFSIYNLTGRDNVYNAYFSSISGRLRGYRISIFAIPIFSATYNFKLGNYES